MRIAVAKLAALRARVQQLEAEVTLAGRWVEQDGTIAQSAKAACADSIALTVAEIAEIAGEVLHRLEQ